MSDFATGILTAQKALDRKDYEKAVRIAEKLKNDPASLVGDDFYLVYYVLAVAKFRMEMESGNPALEALGRSISELEKSLKLNPDHPDSNLMMGMIFLVRAEKVTENSRESFIRAKECFEKASVLGNPWPKEFCRSQIVYIESKLEELVV